MTLQEILNDYQPEADFAAGLGVSRHTVARYRTEPDGLPFAVFGGKIYIHLPGAREWMAKRIQRRAPLRAARAL
jgi:hypothetical protein